MSGKGIQIDLKSTDSSTEKRIDAVIGKLDVLNGRLATTQASFRATSSAASSFANSARAPQSRSSQAAQRAAKPPPRNPSSVLSDPVLRAQVLQGDPWAAKLYNQALAQQRATQRAQKAVNPPSPPSFSQNLQSLLMRSRYGGGGRGGIMPLGMDVLKLLGPIGTAISIALVGVSAQIKVVVAMFKAAAEAVKQYSAALVAGGQGAASAVFLGQFTGAGPTGAASSVRGRGAREKAYGAGIGVSPMAGDPFYDPGGANLAYEKMARAVVRAANKGGFAAAQKEAYRLGAPELAKLGLLSERGRETVTTEMSRKSPTGAVRAWEDLWVEVQAFGKEFKDLLLTELTPWVKLATGWLRAANDVLRWLNDQLQKLFGWTGIFDDLDKKMSEHDQAMDEHTRAMKEHSEYLGGAARARGAVPRNVQGNPMAWSDKQALRESLRLGALV